MDASAAAISSGWSARPRYRLAAIPLLLGALTVKPFVDLFTDRMAAGDTIDAGALWGVTVAGLIILTFVGSRPKLPRHTLTLLLASLAVIVISLVHVVAGAGQQRVDSFRQLVKFVVGFSPMLLMIQVYAAPGRIDRRLAARLYVLLLLVCVPHVLMAFAQYAGLMDFSYFQWNSVSGLSTGRPSGGYRHPNGLGRLIVGMALLTYCVFDGRTRGHWQKQALLFLLALSALVTTHRTTILALFAVVVTFEVYGLAWSRFRLRPSRMVALLLLAPPAVYLTHGFIVDQSVLVAQTVGSLDPTDPMFLRGRLGIWKAIGDMYARLPLWEQMIGPGYGLYEHGNHNQVIQFFVYWGPLGFIAFSVMLVSLFRFTWGRVRGVGRAAVLATYAFLAISSVVMQPMSYPPFMWIVFLVLIVAKAVDEPAATAPGLKLRRGPGDEAAGDEGCAGVGQ